MNKTIKNRINPCKNSIETSPFKIRRSNISIIMTFINTNNKMLVYHLSCSFL